MRRVFMVLAFIGVALLAGLTLPACSDDDFGHDIGTPHDLAVSLDSGTVDLSSGDGL